MHIIVVIVDHLYFSAKHAALRRNSKDFFIGGGGVARNQDNVFECGDIYILGLLFHYKNPTKRVALVQSGARHLFWN